VAIRLPSYDKNRKVLGVPASFCSFKLFRIKVEDEILRFTVNEASMIQFPSDRWWPHA
jgi:hypothetical protein